MNRYINYLNLINKICDSQIDNKNPWINGLMVKGYNWGNQITIGGMTLQRAHAVFHSS